MWQLHIRRQGLGVGDAEARETQRGGHFVGGDAQICGEAAEIGHPLRFFGFGFGQEGGGAVGHEGHVVEHVLHGVDERVVLLGRCQCG